MRKLEFDPGTNFEACKLFPNRIVERKQEIMGTQPHTCRLQKKWYCARLCWPRYRPTYAARGPWISRPRGGTALLESVKQNPYKLGLPIYLESSTNACGFYKKHEFKFYTKHEFRDIQVTNIDITTLGGPVYRQTLTIRESFKPQ